MRRALRLETQLHRRRDLVDILPPRPAGADELFGQFPVLDGDRIGDLHAVFRRQLCTGWTQIRPSGPNFVLNAGWFRTDRTKPKGPFRSRNGPLKASEGGPVRTHQFGGSSPQGLP